MDYGFGSAAIVWREENMQVFLNLLSCNMENCGTSKQLRFIIGPSEGLNIDSSPHEFAETDPLRVLEPCTYD